VAALCRSVVVVQARHRSGALSTASWARELGIPVLAVPGSPLNPLADGPNALVERGDACLLTCSSTFLSARPPARRRPAGILGRVARLLGTEPVSAARISAETDLPLQDVLRQLLLLELEGLAVRQGNAGYVRIDP
jgi:DNA processing protein